MVQQTTTAYHHGQRTRMLVMGIDPSKEAAIRDYEIREGSLFEDGRGAVLEAGFAKSLGIRLHDEIKVLTRRGLKQTTVAGLLELRGVAGFKQAGVLMVPLADAQRWFLRPGYVNTINLVLTPDVQAEQVALLAKNLLPPGVLVRTPVARTKLAAESTASLEQGLKFAYATTLALAMLMILNTFLMNVKERRRQLAVLRAVGATRGQILGMLLREGLVLGVVGTVLGCLAGFVGASQLTQALARVYATSLPDVQFDLGSFAVAACLGPVMALVATYIPAHQAARVTPLEALRPLVSDDSARMPRWFVGRRRSRLRGDRRDVGRRDRRLAADRVGDPRGRGLYGRVHPAGPDPVGSPGAVGRHSGTPLAGSRRRVGLPPVAAPADAHGADLGCVGPGDRHRHGFGDHHHQ